MSIITESHTPLMKQYHEIKMQHPEALLLFQVGDFYELFFEDAKVAASVLGIALTARGKQQDNPIPLCGVPVHALDHYVTKLVKNGFTIAICDQLEQATPGKVVKRGVRQVLTPGTLTDSALLQEKNASYIFSFFPAQEGWGLLFGELLTAQLQATIIPVQAERTLESELTRFFPDEILLPSTADAKSFQTFFKQRGYCTTLVTGDVYNEQEKHEIKTWMMQQFKIDVASYVLNQQALFAAVYYFYAYMRKNQRDALLQFNQLLLYRTDDFLLLDSATQKNLELVRNMVDGTHKTTLFSVIDGAITPMGSRMLKKWLVRPLIKQEVIEQRLDVVELLVKDVVLMQQIQQLMRNIGDIERVIGRIALNRAQLHDYNALLTALEVVPAIAALLRQKSQTALMRIMCMYLDDFSQLRVLLTRAINDDPLKEWIIKKGYDLALDYARELVLNSQEKIIALEREQQQITGIQSLKIRYNHIHGYYIEITKPNMHLVPHHYIRQQSLVGKERFSIPSLQQLELEINRAHKDINVLEQTLFENVKQEVARYVHQLRKLAHALAHIDALFGFATTAYNNGYVRPTFNHERRITIIEGKHPLIAQTCKGGFIPNDTYIDDNASLWIITGPNMGGKSTYLRQVAHIVILAQCGSFIPAKKADVPLLDRVFTRIGAGDNLAEGKSTFLVEMEETAAICTQATAQSLVILDEVGRGTSTFDGLAIAQAVVEYLYTKVQARCLFATHYHELTQLQKKFPGIVSYYAASKKNNHGIVFLYKMIAGVADGSFGVEVAKLAHLPPEVITRAEQLLSMLTTQESIHLPESGQLVFRQAYEQLQRDYLLLERNQKAYQEIMEQLSLVDPQSLSPKQAFDLIWHIVTVLQSSGMHDRSHNDKILPN